jgi:hypothetical protein
MASYISTSKPRNYFIVIAVSAVLLLLASSLYTYRMNPEVEFWSDALEEKFRHFEHLRKENAAVHFIGGSSCAFGINPKQLEETKGIQSVNWGVNAASGRAFQTELALQKAQRGDLIVIAFENSFYSEQNPFGDTGLGSQLYFSQKKHLALPRQVDLLGLDPHWSPLNLRPGGYHLSTMTLKTIMGKPPYRYISSDIEVGGYLTFSRHWDKVNPVNETKVNLLSEEARSFLISLVKLGEERGIKVAISLPPVFASEAVLQELRRNNQALIGELAKICPVLEDSQLGASSERKDYADTGWHLTPQAATIRTDSIGNALLLTFPHIFKEI